ncbi:MAG: spore coat protein U domain-containing protein [Spirochaetia bacterium]
MKNRPIPKNCSFISGNARRQTFCGKATLIRFAPYFLTLLLFASFAALGATPASALELHQTPKNMNTTFDLDKETINEEDLTIRSKDGAASYFLTFSGGQAGDTGGRYLTDGTHSLHYGIYDGVNSRTLLKDIDDNPSSDEVLSGSLEDRGNNWTEAIESFAVILEYDQFPPAGQYTDDFTITLYKGNAEDISSAEKIEEAKVKLRVKVESVLDISLVPRGSSFDETKTDLTLDFGVLSAGSERSGDIMVRSNDTYSLTLNSENGGVMENFYEEDTSTVPYTLSVNGSELNLSSDTETTVAANDGPTPVTGERYTLNVRIGDFGMATEGEYQDIISVTVTAP